MNRCNIKRFIMNGKKSNFQINSSVLFLTYPECEVPKEELFEFLLGYEKPKALEVLVASETHKNGHPHLHAYVKFESPYRTRDPKEFDLRGFHGNYQGARSAKNVLKYCTKEENYVANFDLDTILMPKQKEKELLGKRILNGEDLYEIVSSKPELILGYSKLRQDVEEFRRDQEESKEELDLPSEIPNPWGLRMGVDTDLKKCHLWVYSKEPNKGKTSGFLLPNLETLKGVLLDFKSTYHEVRKSTKIIGVDELRPKEIRVQTLNKLCDGTFTFRRIFYGEFRLNTKPIVIVCSNFSIQEVFPNDYKLVDARFNEYCVD